MSSQYDLRYKLTSKIISNRVQIPSTNDKYNKIIHITEKSWFDKPNVFLIQYSVEGYEFYVWNKRWYAKHIVI